MITLSNFQFCRGPRGLLPFLLALLLLTAGLQAAPQRDAHTEAQLIAQRTAITPGQPFTVALRLTMDEHWHTYWRNPGDSGMPTSLKWELPAGFSAGPIQWPAPHYLEVAGLVSYAYEGTVLLLVEITPPAQLAEARVTLRAGAAWLACKEECIPGRVQLKLDLPVQSTPAPADERWAQLFAQAQAQLPRTPADGAVSAVQEAGRPVLRFPLRWGGDAQQVRFFPLADQWLELAAPQTAGVAGELATLALPVSSLVKELPTRLTGVLVIEPADGGARQAWAVDVPLGAPPAGVASSTAAPALSFGAALLYAFLGGLLLNLMPCVFPVLSIKVLGFVQQAGGDQRAAGVHGWLFALGVLVSFWVLTAVLLGLRAGGSQLGWGFQLQEPVFVAAMALLMFAVGLNLAGVFEVGLGVMTLAGKASGTVQQEGKGGAFFSGVLATAIATPCTAPLMGPAVGLALTWPMAQTVAVFTMLGVGMAAPYVVLSLFPAWLKWLPRPGAWMETFKQVMAFPMFLTALWLAWVFSQQAGGALGMALLLAGALALAWGAWAWGRWQRPGRSAPARGLAGIFAAGMIVLALALPVWAARHLQAASSADSSLDGLAWEPYSDARLAELRAAGKVVLVDFTADWCLTCKVNEATVLSTAAVRDAVNQQEAALLKADWTRQDEAITKALARFGRSSVPLYVVYGPGLPEPRVLPTVITPALVVEALEQAGAGS